MLLSPVAYLSSVAQEVMNLTEKAKFGRPFAQSMALKAYFLELGFGSGVSLGRACLSRSCSTKTLAM